MYAEIIIPLALPKNYTWRVPTHLLGLVKEGCRVELNFGKHKKYAGVVKRLHEDKPDAFEPKEILNLLDPEPIIHERQLKLWEWLANYYMCSEGEIMQAALPAHFKLSSETILVFNEEFGDDFQMLDNNEYLVAEALLIKKELKITEVQQVLDSNHVYPVIRKLIDKRVCFVWEALKETYNAKKETFITLQPEYEDEEKLAELLNKPSRAPKQMELLLAYLHLYRTEGSVTQTELLKKSGATAAQVKGLVEKNILFAEKRSIDRIQSLPKNIQTDFTLTPHQELALTEINKALEEKQVCLLHGVTSSGKTQVYVKLIEAYVRKGKQVLYMLPEIALTSQVIRRLQKYFGGYIAIYHSKFNQNERVEIWNRVKTGETRIVLGARSSLFLPFAELGLVVVDEEHDPSFKQQEPAPRYHARDTAIYYAALFKAKVVLGSATPSIESYFNAMSGKYGLATLTQRYGDVLLPEINIIDTRKLVREDSGKVMLSPALIEGIQIAVANKKQVILFQNRRGYSPYQVCKACGWIPHCKHCDVSLTYHKQSHQLRCHYCGTIYPPLHTCAACGTHEFVRRNFGTEKIEEVLEETFPEARVARMDIDSVRGKNAHDALIQLFEQHRIDILVGTQMVVKGLDFENVELVGILDADSILGFADFRVNERAFQLMEQVSGRAGRKADQGKVLIQAMQIKHPVLQYVQQHDYKQLYETEIENRKQFFYPPFSRVICITFKHKLRDVCDSAANIVANALKKDFGQYLNGPAEPIVNRVRNQYLFEILLKLPKDAQLINYCKHILHQQTAILKNDKMFRSVVIIADMDAL
jgi:primosomal protein N' (replication factor Y) (superfamily II helicase)